MKSMIQAARNVGRSARRHSRSLAVGAVTVATTAAASAQTEPANAGIAEVQTAITSLGGDLPFIVTAAVIVALVGIGAAVALSVGKRLLGK